MSIIKASLVVPESEVERVKQNIMGITRSDPRIYVEFEET